MSDTMLSHVLHLARLGHPVFPCAEKQPRIARGFHAATTDEGQLTEWWTRWPHANIGLHTAALVVIDIDPDGLSWARDERIAGILARAGAVCRTPRGGLHYYFRQPVGAQYHCSTGRLAPGVDVRAIGGFVLVPPSRTKHGDYRWQIPLDVPPEQLPELPAELQQLLGAASRPTETKDTPAVISQGRRHVELLRLAGRLRAYGLDADEIFATLVAANHKRCNPPEAEHELRKIADSVARYPPNEVLNAWLREIEQPSVQAQPDYITLAEIEEREVHWLWPGYLPRGRLTLVAGHPKVGKSFVTCDLAARVSAGLPWPSYGSSALAGAGFASASAPAGDVIMVSAEDDPSDTIRPRCRVAGADLSRVWLLRGRRVMEQQQVRVLAWTVDDDATLRAVLDAVPQPRLIVIDPIGHYIREGVDAYRDNEVRQALQPLLQLALERDVAVLLLAHTRKATVTRADDAVLGSRAFSALPRSILHVVADQDDKTMRHMIQSANQHGPLMPSFTFRIAGSPPRVEWVELDAPMDLDARMQREATPQDHAIRAAVEIVRGFRHVCDLTELQRQVRSYGVSKQRVLAAVVALGGRLVRTAAGEIRIVWEVQ